MKFIKVLTLLASVALSACAGVPADLKNVEVDTINKRMVVVAKETEAVFKTANQLYGAGMLPYKSQLYNAVDNLLTKLKTAYDKLKEVRKLSEFDKQEKDYKLLLLQVRDFLYSIQKHYEGAYERGKDTGHANRSIGPEGKHRSRLYSSAEAC